MEEVTTYSVSRIVNSVSINFRPVAKHGDFASRCNPNLYERQFSLHRFQHVNLLTNDD
jgi:hypothetical protein